MPDEIEEKSKRVKISDIPRKRSDQFVSAYSNHTEAGPGFYELRLSFCQITADPEGNAVNEQRMAVVMAWEHAVRLRDLLVKLTQSYELEHGKIRPLPEATDGPQVTPEPSSGPTQ